MKLKTVSVTGLFNRFDHTIDIMPDGLTFIHSPNGYGKSTFVRMIYLVLKWESEELMDIPFSRFDIGFTDGADLIVEKVGTELRVQMRRNEIQYEMSEDEVRSLMEVILITSERLIVKKMDGRLVPALESYALELSERVRNAMEDNDLEHVEGEDMGDDEIVFRSKDLKARLDFIKEAGFEAEIPAGLRFPPSRYDLDGQHKEYLDLLYSLTDFADRNYYLAESIVVFKDILNNLLIEKNIMINENGVIGVEFDDGTSLPLNRVSSGEKQLLVMFYRLLFHAQPSSLVIIDEPEISLHISWQQRIGTILLDISRLRGLQVIVATHSPQIVHDKWNLANELRADRA